MPRRTDNSFTRPLPYCPTSTCGLTAVCCGLLEINCAAYIYRAIRAFSRQHVPVSRITAPPEPAAWRYIASPVPNRLQPVFSVRLSHHCMPCQHLCATHPDCSALFRVSPYRTGYSRFFWVVNTALRAPPAPIRHPPRLLIPAKAEIPPKRHV